MDNPYLNRGESIILTTRLSLDSVPFDALLTTERLILIDDRYSRFQPRTIMLTTVISVRSGKMSTEEPVIMLSLTQTEGEPQPLNLVFSQQYGEKRSQERDNWVKKIMELRVLQVQNATPVEILPVSHEPGMHPSVRRWVAPEKIRPHRNVAAPPQEPIPLVVIPDEPEVPEPDKSEENVVFKEPVDFSGSADIEWPVIRGIKEELPENSSSEPLVENESSDLYQESFNLNPLPDEPETPEPDKSEENVVFKEPVDFSGSADIEWPVIPEIKSALPENLSSEPPVENESSALSQEPASQDFLQRPEVADFPVIPTEEPESSSGIFPELVSERDSRSPFSNEEEQERSIQIVLQPLKTPGHDAFNDSNKVENYEESSVPAEIHETLAKPQFSVPLAEKIENPVFFPHPENASDQQALEETPATQTFSQQSELETVVTGGESNGKPISPAPVFGLPGSFRHPEQKIIINACIILVSILLLTGGIMILSSHLFKDNRIVGEPVINSTPIIEQISTIPPVLVPQTDLWVRINFSGYYTGKVGNPDFLQPVSGTGDQFYKILNSDDLVQVAVEKQDNSGNPLSVEVYKEGILIYTRTITAPMGSIELLIDAKTARPPGITVNVTAVGNRSGSAGRLEYF
jgi:hypothetical protein